MKQIHVSKKKPHLPGMHLSKLAAGGYQSPAERERQRLEREAFLERQKENAAREAMIKALSYEDEDGKGLQTRSSSNVGKDTTDDSRASEQDVRRQIQNRRKLVEKRISKSVARESWGRKGLQGLRKWLGLEARPELDVRDSDIES